MSADLQAGRPPTESRIEGGIEWFPVTRSDEMPDEDCQCARCGSSVDGVRCGNCGGEGSTGSACIDDLCYGNDECIHGDTDMIRCDWCEGEGGSLHCISGREWCEAHPLPGREHIESTAFADPRAWDD